MGKIKRKCLSLFLTASLTVGAVLPSLGVFDVKAAANLTEGLVGHWTFDGASDEDKLANQASGQSCTASKVGNGVTLKNDGGVSGGSIYFSKEDNSYLKLNLKDASQGLNAAEQDFSLAAWVKFDSSPFQSGSINLFQQTADITNTGAAGRTILYLNSSRKYGTYLTGSDVVCDQAITLGSWHHIVFTSNHTTKKVQFYVNGTLASENVLTEDFINEATDILVGAHKNPQAAGAIKGSVDELRYYNKVIDADTAQALYDAFGDATEIESLSAQLQELITEAEGLSGGDEKKKIVLLEKIADAKALLEDSELTVAKLNGQLTELQTAVDAYKKTVVISIEVDASEEVREISDAMFGINHRYHNDAYSSWNAKTQTIEPEFDRLVKEASFGSVRYPGGTVSNLYDWKKAIGPVKDRKKTINGNYEGKTQPIDPNFGVDEAMKWIYDDLHAEAVWVYAMGQGSAQDAADLFEYLNAPADGDLTNPNGGTDWAEIRAEYGHEEPYGVTRFEIGNEMGLWGQNYWLAGRDGTTNYDSMAIAYVNGGEMNFTKQNAVREEDWRDAAANSNGEAGQVFYAKYKFVKENSAHVYVNNEEWQIVESLDEKGAENVCELECDTGKITFGDGTHGNIPPSGQTITVTYTSIQDGFTVYYDALKDIAEELGMDVQVYSCMEREKAISELNKAEGKYDGAVIHPYSETNGGGYDYNIPEDSLLFYEEELGRSLQHNMTRVQNLIDMMEAGKVPVVSEFGIFNHNTQFIRAMGHAVYIANEMIDYVNFGTPYLNKHCLVDYPFGADGLGPGSQCVIQAHKNGDGTVDFVSTPSAKAFSIFNNMTGSTQIGQTIDGNDTYYTFNYKGSYDVQNIKAISSKDEEGNIYVTVVNNKKNDSTFIEINADNRDLEGEEIEVWYLTSKTVYDENTVANPNNVDVVKETTVSEGEIFSYELTPHSITAFKIPAEKKASVSVRAEAGGTAEGSAEIKAGSEVTVTAVPNEGYLFDGWYVGDKKVSDQAVYTFAAEEDTELIAKFTKKEIPKGEQPPTVGDKVTDTVTNGTYTVVTSVSTGITAAYTGMANQNATTCTIPNTIKINGVECKVTSIAKDAFQNNKKLTSVTIGDQIEKIGENAFSGCTNLKAVTIGKNVTEIEKKAFYKNTSLKKITIPASIKKIGASAFQGAKKLKKITIQTKSLTKKTVGKNAFKQISAKAKIKVPANKLKAYKKLLKSKGLPSKASVKK